jgi:hypothetical protein
MHTAYLIYSPALLDDLPYTPEAVARLSAFARLVGADASARAASHADAEAHGGASARMTAGAVAGVGS